MDKTSKRYTNEELTVLLLEAQHEVLKKLTDLDLAFIQARSEINEMYNNRVRELYANSEFSKEAVG